MNGRTVRAVSNQNLESVKTVETVETVNLKRIITLAQICTKCVGWRCLGFRTRRSKCLVNDWADTSTLDCLNMDHVSTIVARMNRQDETM